MKSLQEILTKNSLSKNNLKEFGNYCAEWLIEHGYIHSEVFGWERMEIIEQFKLDPELKGIPAVYRKEIDYKDTIKNIKDEFGKSTGEKQIVRTPYETGKMILGPADNYMAYLQFKKDRWAKYDAEDYAKRINTPPVADEYYQN